METKQFSPAELIRNNFPRPREGNRKGGRWAKRTTCFRGHALTEDNIYVERRGDGTFRRRCRMCWIENAKRMDAVIRRSARFCCVSTPARSVAIQSPVLFCPDFVPPNRSSHFNLPPRSRAGQGGITDGYYRDAPATPKIADRRAFA